MTERGWEPGRRFGRLLIESPLGRGGFATVHLARDERLRRKVALKVLTPNRAADLDRIADEARLIAELKSPHVVTLYHLHDAPDGAVVLEMEYVEGGSLADAAQCGGIPAHRVETILRGVLAGLAAAHASGIVHRDVKPANVLLDADGVPKLTDFGLARRIAEDLDLEDQALGTPVYMAPEVLLGEPPTARSDLWSFGVLAYELLTGRRPFDVRDAPSFFAAVQNEEPPPLPPLAPARLRALVERCLSKRPAERPADAGAALGLLEATTARASERATPAAHRPAGRDRELGRIESALDDDATDTLVVAGPAGIGKSEILRAAAARSPDSRRVWIRASLSPFEGPLATLLDAARASLAANADPDTAGFGPEGSHVKALLRPDAEPRLEDPEQALWTLQHLLAGVAASRPLVLCIDDAQHAAPEDVQLLENLARRLSDRPFTLLVATRPGSPAAAAFARAPRLDLAGLDAAALYAALDARTGAGVPPEVAARIHERTGGNPLHALELLRHLEERGALRREGNRLVPDAGLDLDSIPERLRDVVQARLASLDDEDRALLEVAAVDGTTFDGRALAAVLDVPLLGALRRLQALCRTGMIAAADDGYRFAERPIYEVLYEGMATELRRELHRALAEHLEARTEPVDAARLARHWEGCGERRRAAPYLLREAERASARQETGRFRALAERAGVLDDPPLVELAPHFELLLELASWMVRNGDGDRADALFERLADAGGGTRDRLRVRTRQGFARVLVNRGSGADIDHWVETAHALGRTVDAGLARLIAGSAALAADDLTTARVHYTAAVEIFEETGSESALMRGETRLGILAMRERRFPAASAYLERSAARADRIGLRVSAAINRLNGVIATLRSSRFDVDETIERAIREFDLAGNTALGAHARLIAAEAALARGDTARTATLVEQGIPALAGLAQGDALLNLLRLRAELHAMGDRLGDAQRAIDEARAHLAPTSDLTQVLLVHAVAALIATADGRLDDAARAVDDFHAANPERRRAGDGSTFMLSEAVLIGLPPELLESSAYTVRVPAEQLVLDATLRLVRGEDDGGALEALRQSPRQLRAAHYDLMTAWLATEFAARDGNREAERAHRKEALRLAAMLGHARAAGLLRP